jgi:hypothetical protein
MISFAGTNWLGVIAATLAYYLLGAIWFTPLFGRAWDRAIGFQRPERWRPAALYYLGPLAGCFIATLATSALVGSLGAGSVVQAAALGLVVGVGYGTTVSVVNAITPHTPRPLLLGSVTGAYHAVGITLAAVILSFFA